MTPAFSGHREARTTLPLLLTAATSLFVVACASENDEPLVEPTESALAQELTPGSWTLAVIPDTQYYSLMFPDLFTLQTRWLARAAMPFDIRYAFHLGDVVHGNTDVEWQRGWDAMAELHGVVPYVVVPGNHDYGPAGNASTRDTRLNAFFPVDDIASWDTFGGAYQPGELDNTYHLFSAGSRDFIVLALEWGPRDDVIEWANQVMDEHADRDGILVTHAYMSHDEQRYDHTDTSRPQPHNPHNYATEGGVNDGEELWQKLVRHHRFVMTFNGHVLGDGTGYLASVTDAGTTCHQMLSNYQFRSMGGEAYLRLLELLPDGETVEVYSYSPLYDELLTAPDQRFTIRLD